MSVAITRGVGTAIADCELTFLPRRPIDYRRAREQHAHFTSVLRTCDHVVVDLPPDNSLPDSCFVEDAAVVLDEIAVMTRMLSPIRRREQIDVETALAQYRTIVRLDAPASLEGGDVLRLGRTLFVGQSQRTDSSGIQALAAILEPHAYRVVPVPVRGCLHLKTACTAIAADTLLVNERWIDSAPLSGFRLVPVPEEEPWAANTLRLNDTVYVSADSVRTAALLETLGITVRSIDISEFRQAEAGLTCLALLVA